MILVDTVIWADHFGKSDSRLVSLLDQRQVCTHPHVIGELALGNLRQDFRRNENTTAPPIIADCGLPIIITCSDTPALPRPAVVPS